jgi:hypothetical protein
MLNQSHEVGDMFDLNVETNKMDKINQVSCIILILVASSTIFKIYGDIIFINFINNFKLLNFQLISFIEI